MYIRDPRPARNCHIETPFLDHETLCHPSLPPLPSPSDLVGFSTWASTLNAEKVMATLNNLFSRLDTILLEEMPELYKVLMDSQGAPRAANMCGA